MNNGRCGEILNSGLRMAGMKEHVEGTLAATSTHPALSDSTQDSSISSMSSSCLRGNLRRQPVRRLTGGQCQHLAV